MLQYQVIGNDITFIFPPQFGLLKANVTDFMESYSQVDNCIGCTNQTVSIRQLTNISLTVDNIPLTTLEASTNDFYYVLLSLFLFTIVVTIAFLLFRKLQIYKSFLVHFFLYFQQSLFIVFSSNILLQSNFNILFLYQIPFLQPLEIYTTPMDNILHYTLDNYLLNMIYSILLIYALIVFISFVLFIFIKLFPVKQHSLQNWRFYLQLAMNKLFLLFGPVYLISMLPLSIATVLLLNESGNQGVLVFLFFYLILPLLFLIYLNNKYNTYQIESIQITSNYFSNVFNGVHQHANKSFICLVIVQILQGVSIGLQEIPRFSVLLVIEVVYVLVVSLNKWLDDQVPLLFSGGKILLFIAMLVDTIIATNVTAMTISGFVVVGVFIIVVLILIISMFKQCIPDNTVIIQHCNTPPGSPVDRRSSIRRQDWLQDEFDDVVKPTKILERAERKKKGEPLRIDTRMI